MEWAAGAVSGGSVVLAVDLSVAGPVVLVGAAGAVGITVCGVYGTAWVINGPLGPSYPLPEEFNPDRPFGTTYPLPEGSTTTIDLVTDQATSGAEGTAYPPETPSLEIPDLQASAETRGLELPTTLEAGKNAPMPGEPWRRRPLPEHRAKPGRPLPPRIDPPPEIGPPKWPPGNAAEFVAWVMYAETQLVDKTQLR